MAYTIWLYITLLLIIGTGIAEPIALTGISIRDRITALTSHDRRNLVAYQPPPVSSLLSGEGSLQALDVVLLASVDGKFHALNRSNGAVLWSMSASASSSVPTTLGPLVRTTHADYDPDLTDDDASQEHYIIEPQSGDIYVMSSPSSPLQRLHLSMAQLVDMSPLVLPGEDGRVFVARKETSLILIELETGRIKATLNSECPWDPFKFGRPSDSDEIDLDELEEEASHKEVSVPTEVFIGRTDYYVSIYSQPSAPSSKPIVIQNLSYSTYGPNNQDVALQARYRRTPDDLYVQSLPDGKTIAWKTRAADDPDRSRGVDSPWARHIYSSPIVAVFDVLKSVHKPHPYVLLQPPLKLYEDGQLLPNRDAAYVGIVEETGSLFAMTPEHYPLVAFSDINNIQSPLGIDPPPGLEFDSDETLPPDVDTVTRIRERRRLLRMCREGSTDRRCLTGVRPLKSDSRSRLSRLLDESPGMRLLPGSGSGASHNTQAVTEPSELPSQPLTGLRDPWSWQTGGWTSLALLLPLAVLLQRFFRSRSRNPVRHTGVQEHAPLIPRAKLIDVVSQAQPQSVDEGDVLQQSKASNGTTPPTVLQPSNNGNVTLSDALGSSTKEVPYDAGEGEDSDKDGDAATPGKRKTRRGKRGKKKKGNTQNANPEEDEIDETGQENVTPPSDRYGIDGSESDKPSDSPATIVLPATSKSSGSSSQSLVVSEEILGFGSHGTVVFRGSFQGRAVAVKRLLRDFVTLASREVGILRESDDHPNVIRYYYQEAQSNFLYIALELCPASLADVVEQPDQFRDISISFDPKRALHEITSGLRHLHSLKIVHRDIKPQNILVSAAKKTSGRYGAHRMLISDFGLCKKLDIDQTSFLPTAGGAMAVGTVGWRAPEILKGEVKLDEALSDDQSQSSRGSVGAPGATAEGPARLTKAVDIFALGCLFYYVLTNGGHPFGDRFEREVNIVRNSKRLDGLDRFGEEGSEAANLVGMMLDPEASQRPDTSTCLLHPYFWDAGRRLTFLQDASDRFEIMCRDPRDLNLVELEKGAMAVVGVDWPSRLDKSFVENLGKFRKYNKGSVQDLLRALRNKKHHYQDLPDHVKRTMGGMPEGFLQYFTRRFPQLFLHVHGVIATSPLRDESIFRSYFELTD